MRDLVCPECQRSYPTTVERAGKPAQCKCGKRLTFPAAESEQPPVVPSVEKQLDTLARLMDQVRQDDGPFFSLQPEFAVNGMRTAGKVIVSPTAIYLRKLVMAKIEVRGIRTGAAVIGGVLGEWVASRSGIANRETMETCRLSDLPEILQRQLNPKDQSADPSVIIIPKSTVQLMEMKSGGVFSVRAGQDVFTLNGGPFQQKRLRGKFERAGWVLGQEQDAADTAVHDTRPESERAEDENNGKKRVRLFVGVFAGLLVITVVFGVLLPGTRVFMKLCMYVGIALFLCAGFIIARMFPRQRMKIGAVLSIAGGMLFFPLPMVGSNHWMWYSDLMGGEDTVFVIGLIGLLVTVIGLATLAVSDSMRRAGR